MIRRRIFLAWLIIFREKVRLLVALSGIAFAGMLIFIQLGFQDALFDSNTRFHQSLKGDLVLIGTQARNLANMSRFPRRRLYQAMNFAEVASAEPLYINFANWKHPQTHRSSSILVIGFDPSKPVFNLDRVNQNLDLIKLEDTLLFDSAARGEYDLTVASIRQGKPVTTEIEGRKIELSGLFTIGASFAADAHLITSDFNFLRIITAREIGQVSIGIITLKPGVNHQKVATALKAELPDDIKVLTHEEFINFEKNYWRRSTAIGFIFAMGTTLGFIVGVVIVYQILYSDVSDHLAEYATLKAIGFSNFYFLSVVFQESLLLAILGYIPGFIISIFLYQITKNATRLPITMSLERAITVLFLILIMCCISGALSMRKLQKADPADIF